VHRVDGPPRDSNVEMAGPLRGPPSTVVTSPRRSSVGSRSVFQYLVLTAAPVAPRRPDRRLLARVRRRSEGRKQPQRRHHRHPPGARLPRDRAPIAAVAYRIDPDIATWVDVNTFHRVAAGGASPRRRPGPRRPSCCTARRRPSTGVSSSRRPATATGSSPDGASSSTPISTAVKRLAGPVPGQGQTSSKRPGRHSSGLLVDDLDEELVESWLQTPVRSPGQPAARRPRCAATPIVSRRKLGRSGPSDRLPGAGSRWVAERG